MLNLSIIIIVKNAAESIRHCLESVKWADEVIIFDSGSCDDTLKICYEYTQRIFFTDWPGFGPQKNRALKEAQGRWVLSIDADEILSQGLIDEIKQIVQNQTICKDAFLIKRISYFCGKKIRYGDWGSDKVVRLFRNQSRIHFTSVIVHESLVGFQHLGCLKQPIFHYTMKDINQVIDKLITYSTYTAQSAYERHRTSSLSKAIFHTTWSFIRGYLLRLGFLDGREGFILAVSNAVGVFYRYIKLLYIIN